jgi:hypothetical protein
MIKNTYLWLVIIVVAFFVIIFGTYLLGWRHSLNNLSIKTATPTQLASAMKSDNFYASYNENTLLVKGIVSSVSKQGSDNVIGLKADSTYQALCDIGKNTPPAKGSNVSLVAIGATAERQTTAVLLKNCVITSN